MLNQSSDPGRDLEQSPGAVGSAPPGSPDWWLRRLERDLAARRGRIDEYSRYYDGEHPLAFASEKFRSAFGGLFREFADNWCDLVVDAVDERLNVEGFRLGDTTDGDKKAWQIWQYNQLDADSQLAHTDALIHGESYAMVWYGDDNTAEITVEHPNQVIVAYAAGSQRKRVAALKKWVDDDGYVYATVYLPDGIYKYRSAKPTKSASSARVSAWVQREVDGEGWPLKNPLGVVPIVPLVNRPRLLQPGCSEIRKVIPIQNAINKLVADMLVASEFGAFRQRWATGIEIPVDPETNQPIEPFKVAVDRFLISENADAAFGEYSQTDLTIFVKGIEMLVQHVASQTRTPPHYFYLSGQFPSGEAIKSAETGLVAKSHRKMRHFGESWEEVIKLALMVVGSRKANAMAETIWRDPESRSDSEQADAVTKRVSIGVPRQQAWEDLGYSPQQIERFKQMLRDERDFAPQPVLPAAQPAGQPTVQPTAE